MGGARRGVRLAAGVAVAALTAGCSPFFDVAWLTQNALGGRNNGTAGSVAAQVYFIGQLEQIADGLNAAATGDEAYLQPFTGGTNVVAVIPGTDLADEYVILGAHYDHLGTCRTSEPGDTVCNGATDNATGVAAALDVFRRIARQPTPPRRSVVIALWDREEDGLLGSLHYVQNPLVPLADTVAYVNFDIQGANLLPSLRTTTFAVGAETGGAALEQLVRDAAAPQALDTELFSAIFGQGRSDYLNFINSAVPSVFFSDSTGPCYHTNDDELGIVDFDKLDEQIETALALTRELADTDTPPAFVTPRPLAVFGDAVTLKAVVDRAEGDLGLFSPADQATLLAIQASLDQIVADGEANFGSDDVGTILGHAVAAVDLLTRGECDGFLPF